MRSCCSTPRTAVAGARSATSAQAPCRSTKRSSASATIHISWTYARPTVEPLQRIDAKQECRSLETTEDRLRQELSAEHDRLHPYRACDQGNEPGSCVCRVISGRQRRHSARGRGTGADRETV